MNLDLYRTPVALSAPGKHAALFDGLPRDVGALARIAQGLLIHEHMTEAYGVKLAPARHAEAHVRPLADVLDRITSSDPRPLSTSRAPEGRYVCVCRSFALLMVAMLRSQGTPARARCGFGMYFEKGKGYDHWVTEYWNAGEKRWVLVDAQIDDRQRRMFGITIDTLDVPRDQFLVAGDAWRLCRTGKADPKSFGILNMWGYWFIASNIVRDVAALNNREMQPWDCWGIMTQDDKQLDNALLDRLAELTRNPDENLDELRALYRDPRLVVPPTVFNAVLNRPEAA
ncbi:MAG TPA: transglutaminase-like domain-containing protein [Reyranella sp.]|nr:transglutaminase-like domain-containing protein [Reyranella sp.]